MKGDQLPVINMYCANKPVLICEKAVSNNFAVIYYYKGGCYTH